MWQIEDNVYDLIKACCEILSDSPIAFMINSYASELSVTVHEDIPDMTIGTKFSGAITGYGLGLRQKDKKTVLPCGYTGLWSSK